jgi:multiple sugar transport system permease protein
MTSVSAPTTPAPTQKQSVGKRRTEGVGRLAALLISPTFLVLGLVVGYPILAAFRLAFYQKNEGVDPETGQVLQGEKFVGLDNFTAMFKGETGDQFFNAMWNTTFFMSPR